MYMQGIRGFKFAGKHNDDFDVVMEQKVISFPSKKKVKDSVPFMNGSYDFSTIGTNGEIVYEQRDIKIIIGFPAQSKERLQSLYSKILEWVVDSGKSQLIFDVMPEYYFMAEVESSSTLEETMAYGKIEINMVADPFKKSIDPVGACIWDTFNFEEDYLQDVEYTIRGSGKINILNPGRTVRPVIISTAQMTMKMGDNTYTVYKGSNQIYGFYLNPGDNNITFTGNGTVTFDFRKETL